MKSKLIFFTLLFSSISYSQTQNKVKFKIFESKNNPFPGVNIIVKNSTPIIGTQTNLDGNAELNGIKENQVIEISYLGPKTPNFTLIKSVDSIVINLQTRKAVYYSKKKKIRKFTFDW